MNEVLFRPKYYNEFSIFSIFNEQQQQQTASFVTKGKSQCSNPVKQGRFTKLLQIHGARKETHAFAANPIEGGAKTLSYSFYAPKT